MSQNTELIARMRRASDHIQLTKDQVLIAEGADALQALEPVPMTKFIACNIVEDDCSSQPETALRCQSCGNWTSEKCAAGGITPPRSKG